MGDSSRHEIITLQVGRYANFVGTHFWNFQDELLLLGSRGGVVDEYDHSVLHRNAFSGKGDGSYTPRLVAFDTRDALGSLNPLGLVGGGEGARASAEAAESSWAGGVSVFRQPQMEKNALHAYLDAEDDDARGIAQGGVGEEKGNCDMEAEQDETEDARVTGDALRVTSHPFGLDDDVTNWPDFLKSRLHPRALQEMPFRDESSDFGLYTSGGGRGGGVLGERDREAHSDAFRRQLEECNAAQGTQTLVDLRGGWGGLGASLAVEIEEECRNRPRVCYAFLRRADAPNAPGCHVPGDGVAVDGGSGTGAAKARSAVNLALSLHGVHEAFTMTVVSDEEACAQTSPHLAVNPQNAYHTSAILGSTMDVATSPLRFSSTRLDAWASPGGGGRGGGGAPVVGGGGAFGGGGRAPPPGADMTFATMSAWLPFPSPDIAAPNLQQLLSRSSALRPPSSGGDMHEMSPPTGQDPNLATYLRDEGTLTGLFSLGPAARYQRLMVNPRKRRGMIGAGKRDASTVDERVFSRMMVARGLGSPRSDQLAALEKVLDGSGAGAGASYAASTPLPIPITYPLLFRETLGSRGEQLSSPTSSSPRRPASGGMLDGRSRGEMRVICDAISGIACIERNFAMGAFVTQVSAGLDLKRGRVLLELEKNDLHKDDAVEVLETLTALAESYGHSGEESDDMDTSIDDA